MTKTLVRRAIVALAMAAVVTSTTQTANACGWGVELQGMAALTNNYYAQPTDTQILPHSDDSYLSQWELEEMSGVNLMLARNEIYARHGYIFNDQNIQKYFNDQDWYGGWVASYEFSDSVFNEYERYNISLIVAEENSRGGAVSTLQW